MADNDNKPTTEEQLAALAPKEEQPTEENTDPNAAAQTEPAEIVDNDPLGVGGEAQVEPASTNPKADAPTTGKVAIEDVKAQGLKLLADIESFLSSVAQLAKVEEAELADSLRHLGSAAHRLRQFLGLLPGTAAKKSAFA